MLNISASIKQLLPAPSASTKRSPSLSNSCTRVWLSRHPTLVFCEVTRRKRCVHSIMLLSFMLSRTSHQPRHSRDQSVPATA